MTKSKSELIKYIFLVSLCLQTVICYAQKEDSLLNVIQSTSFDSLSSQEKHKNYLQAIFELDQEIRNSSTLIIQEFGYKTIQHTEIVEKQKEIDRFLFNTMVDYLNIHGHPSKELGEIACYTPQLIFHHVSGTSEDLELKEKFFPFFYQAYLDGAINGNSIYFYLFRLHSQILNQEYKSELNEEEQIKDLIEILQLNKE